VLSTALSCYTPELMRQSGSTITYDTLVRAGVSVTSVFVSSVSAAVGMGPTATCSRGVKIIADASLETSELSSGEYDMLVVPGGAKGAETISKNATVQKLVKQYYDDGKLVGMICAGAPRISWIGS
jgi:protein DJ-1